MSSAPQGPGWWQASDGCWYPPQPPAAVSVGPARSKGISGFAVSVALILLAAVALFVGILLDLLPLIFVSVAASVLVVPAFVVGVVQASRR